MMQTFIRRLFAIGLIVSLTLTASCDDDEKSSASVVGKWKLEKREVFNCPDQNNNRTDDCNLSPTSAICGTWEFKIDGKYTVTYSAGGGYTQEYEQYPPTGLNLCTNGVCTGFTYAVTGSKLIITQVNLNTGSCLQRYTFAEN